MRKDLERRCWNDRSRIHSSSCQTPRVELPRVRQDRTLLLEELVAKVVVVLGVEEVECFVIVTAAVGIVEVVGFVVAVVEFVVGIEGFGPGTGYRYYELPAAECVKPVPLITGKIVAQVKKRKVPYFLCCRFGTGVVVSR